MCSSNSERDKPLYHVTYNILRTCRAISICSRARESFPPESPSNSLSPSSIMLHSLTACPTSFIIFLGGTTGLMAVGIAVDVGVYVTPVPLRVFTPDTVQDEEEDEEEEDDEGVATLSGAELLLLHEVVGCRVLSVPCSAVAALSLPDVSASLFSVFDAFSLSLTADFFTPVAAFIDDTETETGADADIEADRGRGAARTVLARPLLLCGNKYLGN